ncbi:hypothetical protein AVEN_94195-1 [Araneus ventricosus]|uniref:Uncharacterized protein n=1 Tax=Araneus ventricosus TaxID=182803 RepID=A0A4Y2Q6D0_ARAVE|nr:hypothetical protein AVEN_94195-1 [Araneus ventricosus]
MQLKKAELSKPVKSLGCSLKTDELQPVEIAAIAAMKTDRHFQPWKLRDAKHKQAELQPVEIRECRKTDSFNPLEILGCKLKTGQLYWAKSRDAAEK